MNCRMVAALVSMIDSATSFQAEFSTAIEMARSYERFELADVRLFKTADFDCSRSGNLRTVFGTRLLLLFAIGSGLRCRGEKHDPVPDLLSSSAFVGTTSEKPANFCNARHSDGISGDNQRQTTQNLSSGPE